MNPPNGQSPLDYLNQIAPQAPKKPKFALNLKTVIFGALALIALMILIVSIVGGIAGSKKEPWARLAARLNATTVVVDASSDKIKNSQLRSINSDLKLYITNTQRDLAAPLKRAGIDATKLPTSVVAQETGTGMTESLEVGRLNGKYDSTYAREMTYQVATILALLKQLYSSTSTPATKEFLNTAYANLKPTYEALSDFSASNE